MQDDLSPAGVPEKILENARAIDLYLVAVWALSIIGGVAIAGAIVLAFFERTIPGEAWTVVGIAVGALAVMLGGERR